jgi:formylglycine-generating enzyme required for sulfatase activity/DNA-binding SARP family transcriptional activator/energy-coupling factor transporter ATP-binding protein EcfA2
VSETVTIDVLGPLVVRRDGVPVPAPHGLPAALLLYFVVNRNLVVPVDRLMHEFWPAGQVTSVHAAVKQLRRVLEPDRRRGDFGILARLPEGYKLVLSDAQLDSCRFKEAVASARAEADSDPERARIALKEALALWRDRPLQEAATRYHFADGDIEELTSIHRSACLARFETEIRCGNAAQIIPELERFFNDHDTVDQEPRLLLLAYARAGELPKAGATYEKYCDEKEQDPSDEFTRLYTDEVLAKQPEGGVAPRYSEIVTRNALNQYRSWVKRHVNDLDIRWIVRQPHGQITIHAADVFTPLFVDSGPNHAAAPLDRLSLDELVSRTDRVLLLGESGRGKSTFLQHLARRLAADPNGPLPVLIRCQDISDGAWSREVKPDWSSFRAAVEERLEHEELELTIGDLEKLARAGRVVWLLDAINEIPRDLERARLADMLASAARHWAECKWVLTSSSTVESDSIPTGFEEAAEVAEWTPAEIRAFLRSLVRISHPALDDVGVTARTAALLDRVLDHPDPAMRDLARIPLYLTAMAVLDVNGRRPADSRADLLESITSWLMEDRMATLQQTLGSALQVEEVFRLLAYHMVTREGGPFVQLGHLAAADAIAGIFGGDVDAAVEFVKQAATVGGLFVRRGVGDVGFSQDLFRDYLAAKNLAGRTDAAGPHGWWASIEDHLDDPAWRNVVVFVPARLIHLGRERVDLFFERLGHSCHSIDFETRLRRVALGGLILRDLRPLGYAAASHVEGWRDAVSGVRRLFEVPSSDPDLETKFEAAAEYGREGDPRLRDLDGTWIWLDGGEFLMGAQAEDPSQPNFDRDAAPWEAPVHEVSVGRFAIRKYPLTVAEYQAFVADGGYAESGKSFWPAEGWEWRTSKDVKHPLDWDEQLALPNAPVSGVSWFECQAFANWLTTGAASDSRYRLPTEEQWEFAARRGISEGQQFSWGIRMTGGPAAEANWVGCSLRRKSPVGMFPTSTTIDSVADLFGNVEEWCRDEWSDWAAGDDELSHSSRIAPYRQHVVRGGSTIRCSRLCRPSYRSRIFADRRHHTVGFRLVIEIDTASAARHE